MSYLDVFKKKLTVFADEMVIKQLRKLKLKETTMLQGERMWDGQMPRGNWMEG